MANVLYDLARESFLKGEISWSADNIKTVLVDTATYTVNTATDQFLIDIAAGERVATSANLTTKTTVAGAGDADDVTFTAVTGDVSEALVIYQDSGAEATSRLIAYIDTATGLPVTPNGGDIAVQWPAPIFTL
jgi:phage tail sheath gpL-like